MRIEPAGYEIVECVHDGSATLIFRATRRSDGRAVVLKTAKRQLTTPATLQRYQREYALLRDLAGPGIVEVLSLESVGGAPMLVLEDFGAQSLAEHCLRRHLPLRTLLVIATRVVGILAELHDRGVIHGDLNPYNILFNPRTDELKLADFGWSIHRDELPSQERHGGTLAYMSPEHTGRLDRRVDHRTDLYSLGVTLYHLFAHELPFPHEDALKLVHSHVAREAPPLHERVEAIPIEVSDIVDKLMAKMPEDRYHSARGCRADLVECLRQLNQRGSLERFELGREDHRFHVPARLYGRTRERQTMHEVLERVVAGSRQMLLVEGRPGIGKTSLITELGDLVLRDQGHVLRGKFDQYRRSIPYSALAQAFGGLMHTLATKAEDEFERWRHQLGEAIGENAGVLVEVVPELAFLVGPELPVVSRGPLEAENRFHYVFRRFVEVLCRDQPLVVMLDDLQWADHASMRLVKLMLTDPVGGHLLIIGAYRGDEIDPAHPLSRVVEQLRSEGHELPSIHLGPMKREHVAQLVADTMQRPVAECARLIAQVMAKTAGNPFFVRHCLLALHQDGHLRFDPASGGWCYAPEALDELGLTDTVVDLMLSRLRQLPEDTQRILPMAACMGATFDLATLGILVKEDPSAVQRRLAPALDMGLLQPGPRATSQQGQEPRHDLDAPATTTYAFSHDRVQQAAYALIPRDDQTALHLEMARLLSGALSADEREQRTFELVEHYTAAAALIEDTDERLAAARLCLSAGLRAKESMAYEDADRFLGQGRSLMPEGSWREHCPLMRDLTMATMQARYLRGHVATAQPLAEEILRNTQDVFDEIEVCTFQIEFHVSQQQVLEALEIGLEVLSTLGVDLPREVDAQQARVEQLRAQLQLERLDVAMLERLPDMSDPLQAGIQRILLALFTPAYYVAPALRQLILLTQLELCLREGHCPSAPDVYILIAAELAKDNENLDLAHRLGTFALRLLKRFPDPSTRVRTEFHYHSFIVPWNQPRHEALEWLRSLVYRGLASGDVEFACFSAMACASILFQCGVPLEAVRKEELSASALVERYSTSMARQMLLSEERTVCALLGEPGGRDDAVPVVPMAIMRESLAQAMLHYIMGDIDTAFEVMQHSEPHMGAIAGLPLSIDAYLWYPLIELAVLGDRSEAIDVAELLAGVERKRVNLHEWAERVPQTFASKRALVDAEHARVTRAPLDAIMRSYDEAIELARAHDNIREEAIGCERAADFYAALGRRPIADMYRSEAYLAYRRWGARAKVRRLEAEHPWLAHRFGGTHATAPASPEGQRSTRSSHSSDRLDSGATRLDFEAVVQASQALSSYLVLDQLLAELMRIIIENAGAQRGYLLLGGDASSAAPLTVVAEGDADAARDRALPSLPLDHPDIGLARTVVSYVSRTRDSLVLRDAKNEDPYAHDPYVRANNLRSVMCTPVEHQGKFIGVVYLENNLTTNTFTPARAQVVRMLATQAAISIENARLLANLERSKQEAERANRAKSSFLASVNHELRTPLNGIIGAMELLRGMQLAPEQTDYLEVAQTSAMQLLRVIRDTLDVSQIEAGQLTLESIRFSLDECLASLRRILSTQAEPRSIEFSMDVGEDVPRHLIGDRDHLMQILINLLGNAIKFTSSGGQVALRIAVTSRSEDFLHLRFEVRDTGIGIAPDDLQRIFEPFARVRDPGLGKEGTGLGLTIAARLVEMMSGRIGAQSEVGEGSRFWFTARFECAPPERDLDSAEPPPRPPPPEAEGLHILIAEDNRINQMVARRMLEREGHRCTVVNDGAEALLALESSDIDVVFMDVHMPVMDGRAATREIRRREAGTSQHLPIVAVTASATTDMARDCIDCGMDRFLSKPLVRDVVCELLHELRSDVRLSPEAHSPT